MMKKNLFLFNSAFIASLILCSSCFNAEIIRQSSTSSSSVATLFSGVGTLQFTGIKQLGLSTMGAASLGSDSPYDMVMDSSGNIYVGGHTNGALGEASAGGYDAFVAKFNNSGTLQWMRQLGNVTIGANASLNDYVFGINVDSIGDVFIAGQTASSLGEAGGGAGDAYIAKINSSGTFQWVKQLGSVTLGAAAAGDDMARSRPAIDSSGNIYITGKTTGSLGEALAGGSDVYVAKFNSSGTLLWIKQLGNITVGAGAAGTEWAFSVALDTSGNIFIGGYTNGALGEANGGGGLNDAYIAKFNSAGTLQFIRQLGSVTMGALANTADIGASLTLDASGNPYLAGYTAGALGEANGGGNDIFIVKWDNSGTLQWVKQLGLATMGAASSGADSVLKVVTDSNTNIYITGHTAGALGEANGGTQDAIVAKFNSAGTVQWVKQLGLTTMGASSAGSDLGRSVFIDGNDNVIMSGQTSGSLGEANGGASDLFLWSL